MNQLYCSCLRLTPFTHNLLSPVSIHTITLFKLSQRWIGHERLDTDAYLRSDAIRACLAHGQRNTSARRLLCRGVVST